MTTPNPDHRQMLLTMARAAMVERGLLPDFPPAVLAEVRQIQAAPSPQGPPVRDLTDRLWSSIDNADSRDLDQLTVAEAMAGDEVTILVAVADVEALVEHGAAIDEHARHNTQSVYTAAKTFPMLPEQLSTDMTSLNPGEERLAVVAEFVVAPDGAVGKADVYPARVRNQVKLAYDGVAQWLDGDGPIPQGIPAVEGMAESLRLQDSVAQRMKGFRRTHGALSLETVEARPVLSGDAVTSLRVEERNRAKEIVENFMVAVNGVTARYLDARGFPSIRRVVHTPKRWDRIVAIAAEHQVKLPTEPDSESLEEFLVGAKAADPVRFPDLSLAVIKLLGAGEYVAEAPGAEATGHFGLAVRDYGHSTAPNRRYTDLVTQRLLKAAIQGAAVPYSLEELEDLAAHCTKTEDAVNKVERQVAKAAAALLLQPRIGERFDALVTGASAKGTWVRLLEVPVEGRLTTERAGLDVGDRVAVELLSVDAARGHIDFGRADQHNN
ncbi:MAG: RNB domain-containing ribonuclease [Thermoleophilia bacterium]